MLTYNEKNRILTAQNKVLLSENKALKQTLQEIALIFDFKLCGLCSARQGKNLVLKDLYIQAFRVEGRKEPVLICQKCTDKIISGEININS